MKGGGKWAARTGCCRRQGRCSGQRQKAQEGSCEKIERVSQIDFGDASARLCPTDHN